MQMRRITEVRIPIARPARMPAAIGGRVRKLKRAQTGVLWVTAGGCRPGETGGRVGGGEAMPILVANVGSL